MDAVGTNVFRGDHDHTIKTKKSANSGEDAQKKKTKQMSRGVSENKTVVKKANVQYM